jgi:aldehyde:ferredoxin oxidoreductase
MKIIRVDMAKKTVSIQGLPEAYVGLGGRGLTSIMINAEVPAKCDPLGPDNKLIFAPGLLSGTGMVSTSRLSVGAKSPLTGGIKESNAGGTIAAAMGNLGITAIVIEGQAPFDDLYLLHIDAEGKVSLENALEYKGMRTYALVEVLHGRYGKKNAIMCIGPAGESCFLSASIQSSDVEGRPCRSAARGGLGAVMGSKGLKALIVDQRSNSVNTISDLKVFKEAVKTYARIVRETSKALHTYGTAYLVDVVNTLGAFPTLNATRGVMDEWKKINGEALRKLIHERGGKTGHQGCAMCAVQCSNIYVDKAGQYVTGSLEYETIWSMGGMTGIDDLDTIARLDFLCDDIGVDTINTGVSVAVAMDAGYRSFGDKRAAIEMLEEVAKGTKIGRLLGDGPAAVGEYFLHHRIPVVKRQSISAYDPRAMQGYGVTYATSTMGADHTAGSVLGDYESGALKIAHAEGQVEASRNAQIVTAMLDTVGLCTLAASALAVPEAGEAFGIVLDAKLGTHLELEEIMGIGVRVLKAELEFNKKAGFTGKDNRLPDFFYTEPIGPHNAVFSIEDEELNQTLSF